MINRFIPLLLELAAREDNIQIGSGLGGNIEQFLFLLRYTNNLVDGEDLIIEKNEINWGEKLLDKSRKEIREVMNAKLPKDIKMFGDWEKEVSAKLNSDTINAIYTGQLKEIKDLSDYDLTVVCAALAQRLANDTDQTKALPTNETNNVGSFFATCLPFHYFLGLRHYFRIDRLVNNNLDEHPSFGALITKITELINIPTIPVADPNVLSSK